MPRVDWEETPGWAKDAALALLNGRGVIEHPIRYEVRGDAIFLQWGENREYETTVQKSRVEAYGAESTG